MNIVPVADKHTRTMFLDMVQTIYKDDPCYIRPLDSVIEEIFDPKLNSFFQHGEATRFILIDENGKTIGRVAAFINNKKAYGFAQPTGGLGFFETIDSREAAFALFDAARNWLKELGMEAMDGPINFGENDNFWGLLVEGFTPPAFGMNYNPPYYRGLFESYGFENYFEQVTNHLDLGKPFPDRFWNIASRIVKRGEYTYKHFTWKNSEAFIEDFIEVYNDAWQFHENFTPMKPETLRKSLREAKPFLDEQLIWYAYHDDEPIGLMVIFPDVNQILKYFNGKFNLWNKFRFVIYKWQNKMNRGRVVILGVKTKYQRLGIESGIFWHLRDEVAKRKYLKEMEISWVGDFNPKMRALLKAVQADFGKEHITYRFVFDPEKRNEQRAGSIPVDTRDRIRD